MNLKVGDKVKIIGWPGNPMIGETVSIISILPPESEFLCRVKHLSSDWECLMFSREIEIPSKAGTQLLFSFMGETV